MGQRRRANGHKKELKLEKRIQTKKNRGLRIQSGVTLARAMTVLYAVKAIASIVGLFSLF